MLKLFFLENKFTQRIEDWGDYGDVLWSGFADRDSSGSIFIERAGPFTPDIYLTIDFLICTRKIEISLRQLQIKGIDFLPVKKKKIINVDWQKFPAGAEIYDVLLDMDEPDDLIIKLKNDGNLLALMPEYYAIRPKSNIKIRRIAPYQYKTRHSSVEAYDVGIEIGDIVRADTHSGYFVTDRGRKILKSVGGNFLEFFPLKATSKNLCRDACG